MELTSWAGIVTWKRACAISLEAQYRFANNSGLLLQGISNFEKAIAALRTGETTGERGVVLGRLLAILGWFIAYDLGQFSEAMEMAKESLELLQLFGARKDTYIPRSILARGQESLEESYRLMQENLTLAKETGDQWAIADALLTMGFKAHEAGDYERAELSFQESHQQFKQNGDKGGIGETLLQLSLVATDRGRYEDALVLAQETNPRIYGYSTPEFYNASMGNVLYALGAYEEAQEQFEQGLAWVKELGIKAWTSSWLFQLGRVAFHTGDYALATRRHQESLVVALEYYNLVLIVQNYNALGRLDMVQGVDKQARERFQASLEAGIPLGRPPILLANMASVAELFAEEDDLEYAALLAMLITNHPASQAKIKVRGARLLTRLETELTSNDLANIRERSRLSDLVTVAAQLLVDLESP